MQYFKFPFISILLFAWGVLPEHLSGQCTVAFQNCPSSTTIVDCDNSGNENLVWPIVVANPAFFCTNFKLTQTAGPLTGSLVPVGQYLITYYADAININDTAISSASCSFFVMVVKDLQPPVFVFCPPNITVNGIANASGNCSTQAYWPNPIASDNCGNTLLSAGSPPCGSTFQNGTTTVNYTATDATGNSSTCSFTVTVVCVTGSHEAEQFLFRVNISPNPNTGNITVELPQPATTSMTLRITDLTGRLILEKQTEPGSTRQIVQAEYLPQGLYFLQIVSELNILATEKFIKQ